LDNRLHDCANSRAFARENNRFAEHRRLSRCLHRLCTHVATNLIAPLKNSIKHQCTKMRFSRLTLHRRECATSEGSASTSFSTLPQAIRKGMQGPKLRRHLRRSTQPDVPPAVAVPAADFRRSFASRTPQLAERAVVPAVAKFNRGVRTCELSGVRVGPSCTRKPGSQGSIKERKGNIEERDIASLCLWPSEHSCATLPGARLKGKQK
jgi:hypothetical protein